jgi:hypothetical protein
VDNFRGISFSLLLTLLFIESYIDLFHIAKQGNGSRGVRVFNDERVHFTKNK